MIQRIGAIGDIHGEASRLEAALRFFRTQALDLVVCVGDVVDGRGSIDQCCALLRDAGVVTVRGNHDRWFLAGAMRDLPEATRNFDVSPETRAFLSALPATRMFETASGRLLLCHGLGENDMARLAPEDAGYALESNDELQALVRGGEFDWVLHGHTHRRMVRTVGRTTFVNCGTLYHRAEPCVVLVDFAERRVQFLELGEDGSVVPGQLVSLEAAAPGPPPLGLET